MHDPRRALRQDGRPGRQEHDERFHAVSGQVPQARNRHRQPGSEQPLAVADDGPQHRLGTGPGHRRAGRRNRTDHPGSRRQCHARIAASWSWNATPTSAACSVSGSRDRANFDIVEGDVRDLAAILADRGIGQADYIVSGLPVPSFPRDLQHALFRVVRQVLEPEGTFNQITELPWVYRRFYRKFFEEVRFVFEPRNLPPAGAYFCRRVKPIA